MSAALLSLSLAPNTVLPLIQTPYKGTSYEYAPFAYMCGWLFQCRCYHTAASADCSTVSARVSKGRSTSYKYKVQR